MRTFAAALVLSAAATAAAAQTPGDWSGPYVGAAVSTQASSDGDAKVRIDPGQDSIYLTGVTLPDRGYTGSSLENDGSPVLFAGFRRELGGLVVGVEGQLELGGRSTRLDTGPVGGQGTSICIPDPLATQCLVRTSDRVVADIEQERQAALRFSIGMPMSDRLLVSAYAGPAMAWGTVDVTQTTTYTEGSLCTRFCGVSPIQNLRDVVQTDARTTDDQVWGLVAGVTADFKVTDRLTARADLGYQRFEAFRGSAGGTNGGDSEAWAQKAGFTAGLGLSFRF